MFGLLTLFVYLFCLYVVAHIRGRLRKLMAKRPEKEQLRTKGILQGK